MPKYVCVNKCYHKDPGKGYMVFDVGQVVDFPKDHEPPRHFEKLFQGVARKLEDARRRCDAEGVEWDPSDNLDLLREKLGDEPEAGEKEK